jgi:deoxyribodipyrimidine photolyase-related protein
MENRGYEIHYIKITDENQRGISFEDKLLAFLKSHPSADLHHFEIEDRFMDGRIAVMASKAGRKRLVLPSPMFLTSREEFKEYLASTKKPFMKTFYERRRKQLSILVNKDGSPVGGQWSFDADNRERLDPRIIIPTLPRPAPSPHVAAVSDVVDKLFPDHPGRSSDFWLPVTTDGANVWLKDFLENRLHNFGRFEDAITPDHFALFHSVLSPVMNLGLLTPGQVVESTLAFTKSSKVPFNSLEGFIRQVIGWREFVRGIYNFFAHKLRLGPAWYQAETGLPPLDDALRKSLQFGWAHHIERLMIISCVMLLSGVAPSEAYRWFMEMYVDSSDWVMVPNVMGMGQFSDGGIFATKPYVCGSNYILKMSSYKKGPWCDIWDGLYWKFVAEKSPFLTRNPRLSMMVASWKKMPVTRQKLLLKAADSFIEKTCL